MKNSIPYYRISIMIGSILLALYFVLPNFSPFSSSSFFAPVRSRGIKLGLDLQGGVSIILGVDVNKAVQSSIMQSIQEVRTALREKNIAISKPRVEGEGVICTLFNKDLQKDFLAYVHRNFSELVLKELRSSGDTIIYGVAYTEEKVKEISSFAVEQVMRTLRNRIDQFGVTEPDIRTQAGYRIQVQLPGLQDTARAVALLGQTASLEFRFVRDDIAIEQARFDPSIEVLPYIDSSHHAELPISRAVEITGDSVVDAHPSFNQNGSPEVALTFSHDGATRFATLTKEGIGKRLAIVLDGVVYSTPVIREAISGGRASISGNFTVHEAQDLAIILRAGSLPAPVQVLEERTVGPSLGLESIEQGIVATVIAIILVACFMSFYYRLSGVLASCMMFLTLLFLAMELGIMGATLTLPGIAGIVLVLGMSVDANVLVYERIREELARGIAVEKAIDIGFSKAFIAIIDSNITTLLTALVLYQIGTGPVRGFAVTLSMGILASMYTSLYLSKTCFLVWLRKPRLSLSI